jgi:hypothetical protein
MVLKIEDKQEGTKVYIEGAKFVMRPPVQDLEPGGTLGKWYVPIHVFDCSGKLLYELTFCEGERYYLMEDGKTIDSFSL